MKLSTSFSMEIPWKTSGILISISTHPYRGVEMESPPEGRGGSALKARQLPFVFRASKPSLRRLASLYSSLKGGVGGVPSMTCNARSFVIFLDGYAASTSDGINRWVMSEKV
jgi:hypothetical protein